MDVRETVRNFIIGLIIAIAFVLPGVSGAVIAVVFGIYGRLIGILSDLRHRLIDDLHFIVTLGLGLAVGTVLFASGYTMISSEYESIVMLAFIGLIVGQVPEVYKIARKDDEPVRMQYVAWLIAGLAGMVALLFLTDGGFTQIAFDHDVSGGVMSFVSGAILAISGIVPGISGTSVLLAFGIFDATMAVIGDLDIVLLIPLVIGAFIGMVYISKLMDRLLNDHYYPTYYAILGLTIGSVILIIPQITGPVNIIAGIAAVVIGFAVSMLFNRMGKIVPSDV